MASKEKYGENFDFEIEVDASVGTPSAGIHVAECTKAEVTENKAKDGRNLVLDFESQKEGEEGRRVRTWLSLKETARWKLTESLEPFGIDVDRDGDTPTARLRRKDFVGKRVRLQISHEDYMGEQRAKVDRILELKGEHISANDDDDDIPDEGDLPF